MSIEIINYNLDGEENDSPFPTETGGIKNQHSNTVHKQLKATISEAPPASRTLIPVPEGSQLTIIKSLGPRESHSSIDNRIDKSSFAFPSVTKSEELYRSESIIEFRKITNNNESYEGSLVLNNFHGRGFLSTEKNGQKLFYDGLFYVNKLEGYSQIFYEDGTHFQGLFKEHKRYGPGVLTYSNGSQDVGFWNGFSLIRLASAVGSDLVPKLVNTALGETQLLCHKYLIPLCEDNDNVSNELFENEGKRPESLEYLDELMNLTIRNPNSSFFHRRLYDELFFGEQDCNIKVAIDENTPEEPLVEEDDELIRDGYQQTIYLMEKKIKEVSELLLPLVAIKESLLERIRYCTACCEKKDSIELSAEIILTDTRTPAREKDESLALDIGSLKPDVSFYDASLPSDDIYEIDNEEPVAQLLDKSLNQRSLQFCDCTEEQEVDDLQYLEDQLFNILKQETFYRNIKDSLQKKLENLMENEKTRVENLYPRFKKVRVTEVWAWNNEKCLMDIQKHCFKHRNSENMVNFSVSSLISGHRKDFECMGKYEEVCTKFLKACSKGNKDFVRQCLRNDINPNLADGRGNTGIFFAAAANQVQVIPILTNFGSKLDQINDEALTPLALCILKYLSHKYKCPNWEKAFLPEIRTCSIPNLPKWYEIRSFLSLSTISSRNSDSLDQMSSFNQSSRILELFRRLTNLKPKESSFSKNVFQTSYLFDLSCKYSVSPEKPVEDHSSEDIQNILKSIHLTIMTLLDYGADPNIGEVPYPPLVLSLFSENPILVKQILDARADVNVVITDDKLSCQHVMASLNSSTDNIEISRLLIMYECNLNLKALPSHWEDRKSQFVGNIPEYFEVEDFGKNALHLLCMRMDFEKDDCDYFCVLSRTLIEGGINCTETYLGHTALSLAVLAGNVKLIKCLIRTNVFNPYDNLDYDMGNVMTLFTLKRFENVLPIDKCKTVLTALFEADVNVLNKVGDAENAIAFAEEGDALFKLPNPEKGDKLYEKGKDKSKTKASGKMDKRSQCNLMIEFIKDLGRQTIIKQIEMVATEILYEFTEESILENKEVSVALAEFLTPQMLIKNLEVIFRSEKIDQERLNYDYVISLLKYVDLHKKVEKIKKKSKTSKSPNEKKKKDVPNADTAEESIDELALKANFKKSAVHLPNVTNWVFEPGFDDPEIYEVCFHCLRSNNKELKICPRCQMIKFCSIQCNKSSLKLKTRHTCNIVFWDNTEEEREEISKGERLSELAKIVRENCILRLHKRRESRLVQEEQRLLEMWRADTYGTKFLELRPLLEKAARSKGAKNISWNVEGLQKLMERNFQKNPADFDAYSIDALMAQLSSRQKLKRASILSSSRKSARSTLTGMLESAFAQQFGEPTTSRPVCPCPEKVHAKYKRNDQARHQKRQTNETVKLNALKAKAPNVAEYITGQFQDMHANARIHQANTVIKKLKKIPERYQRFIQIIGAYFPDIDLSFWLLPYACCSNGQLFYKFCDNDLFRESYSFS